MNLNDVKREIKRTKNKLKKLEEEYNMLVKYPNYNILKLYYNFNSRNIVNNTFMHFVNYCLTNIYLIKNKKIEMINNPKVEMVLIEFNEYPHIEFIIRYNMSILENKCKYTVVCGNKNYNMIKKFKINNLNIIKKPVDNLDVDEYNLMLSDKNFWEDFSCDHILICNSKTLVFSNNIDDFIKFDYIGAPWLKPKNQKFFQGDGNFSLRNRKKIINICEKYNIKEMPDNLKPLNIMNKMNLRVCPEDVYFMQYLLKECDVNLPKFDDCINFSLENFVNKKRPFGGHNFFKNRWTHYIDFKIDMSEIISNKVLMYPNMNIVKIPKLNELLAYNNSFVYRTKFTHSVGGIVYGKNYLKSDKSLERKINKHYSKVFLYNNRYDHNWRHFLTETFLSLKDVYNKPDVMILVSKNAAKHIFEIFKIMNIKNYIKIDDSIKVSCDEMILPTKNEILEKKFLNEFIKNCVKLSRCEMKNYPKKLFLTRKNNNKSYRYVNNQEELNKLLLEKEYYFLEGGTISLHNQIAIINKSDDIVTQIGANCDNIIFCNNNCKFKIIYCYITKKWARMYSIYKQCVLLYCGNKYFNNGDKDKYNWNYEIDFRLLKL